MTGLENFVKSYTDRQYKHVGLVSHKGTIVSFAMDDARHIYYSVLNLEDTSKPDPTDSKYWLDNPEKLLFPDELIQVGDEVDLRRMPLVKKDSQQEVLRGTISVNEQDDFLSSTARLSADAPFQVLSDGEYIYLFRQAIAQNHENQVFTDPEKQTPVVNATLLLDRFFLIGTRLQPKQEIRYQRSRSKFKPANDKDSLGAKDLEKNNFYEPTQALKFVKPLKDGRFCIVLLPTQQAEARRWQIFAYNDSTKQINSMNVGQSADGLFLLDNSASPIIKSSFAFEGRSIASGLSALLYFQQEKSKTGYDQQEKPLKRDARVMLAIATQKANTTRSEIAILDFGVSGTGELAQVAQTLQLQPLQKDNSGTDASQNSQLDRIANLSEEIESLRNSIQITTIIINDLNQQIEVLNRLKYEVTGNADGTVTYVDATVTTRLQLARNSLAQQQETLLNKEADLRTRLTQLETLKLSVQSEVRLPMPLLGKIDEKGLSVSGAVLEFAWTKDTPQLFENATGQIGLYFRGEDDQFFVAYYDTLTAKAQFQLPNSKVTFIAQSDKPEMDNPTIKVKADQLAQECQLEVSGGGITETWKRLPRNVKDFAAILNGTVPDPVLIGILTTPVAANTDITALSLSPVLSMDLSDRGVLMLGDQSLQLTQALQLKTAIPPSQITVAIAKTQFPQNIPANTPIYFSSYDYKKLLTSSPTSAQVSKGSRLIVVDEGDDEERIPNGTANLLNQTLNCHWTGKNPGNALQFDGTQTYAALPAERVSKMEATQDLSLETWVKPDRVTDRDLIIHHASSNSDYTLGLTQLSKAFRFDGNAWITLPDSLKLDNRDFTAEAWIKLDSTVSGERPILLMRLPSGSGASSTSQFLHLVIRNEKAYLGFYFNDLSGEQVLANDTWYHVTWRYNHTTKEQAIFINGELDTKRNVPESFKGTSQLHLGNSWADGLNSFKGTIDEFRIWSTARTDAQIKDMVNRRVEGTEPGLLGCWRWNIKDNAVKDHSPNRNHGTIQGTFNSADPALFTDYTFFAGVNQQFRQATMRLRTGDWQHLAAVFNQSYAVKLNGGDSVLDCGNNTVLDLRQDLTLEVCCWVENVHKPRGLVSKGTPGRDEDGMPYLLYIDTDQRIVFSHQDAKGEKELVVSKEPIKLREFCSIAITRKLNVDTQERRNSNGDLEDVDVRKQWIFNLYVNGQLAKLCPKNKPDEPRDQIVIEEGKEISSSNESLLIGKTPAYKQYSDNSKWKRDTGITLDAPFLGTISEVRIWNTARTEDIGNPLKGNEAGLVAWWRLEENSGTTTEDRVGKNVASMKSCQWVISPDPDAPALKLYSNGVFVQSEIISSQPGIPALSSRASNQFSLGGRNPQELFQGILEETRIWRVARTPEQIRDNLYRRLLDEREDLLAYYTFDAESPTELKDQSSHENHLQLQGQVNNRYIFSDAPISDDVPQVRSALAGIRTRFHDIVHSQPGVQEYGDVQYDSSGRMIGILKRCYCYIKNDRWELLTGFKVGDLVTEWIGQVQFDPQLIGFIEGAPPVPSENLTNTNVDHYRGASSIELTEAQETTYTYSTNRERGSDLSVATSLETGFESKTAMGAGIGVVAITELEETKIKGGLKSQWENSYGWLDSAETSNSKKTTKLSQMALQGSWENEGSTAYEVGRRFVPLNVGFALVQSETADVFALRLKHNNALVSLRMQPNLDIPRDWNIITFPMNPGYTKQGTLDGKIGFQVDSNYPQAANYSNDSSYFKPRQAYALKQKIQREEEQRKIKYDNYKAGELGRKAEYRTEEQQNKLPRLEKRNLVNTYVWTADGGLFAETQETMDVQQEMIGGSYSFKGMAGGTVSVGLSILKVASKFTLDAMAGGHINHQHTKTSQSTTSFGLNVTLALEGDIIQRDANGKLITLPGLSGIGEPQFKKEPGKVDAYRFMTFYLEPQSSNFEDFFSIVVDPIWLRSSDPNAKAVLKAKQDEQKPPCWRVMHRVTYISRVLPDFSELPTLPDLSEPETSALKAIQSAGFDSVNELMKQLEALLQGKKESKDELRKTVEGIVNESFPQLKEHVDEITEYLANYLIATSPPSITN